MRDERQRENIIDRMDIEMESMMNISLRQVELSEIVGAESGIALGTLSLSRVVALLETVVAEDVKAFGEHRVLLFDLARGTSQLLFVLFYLFA